MYFNDVNCFTYIESDLEQRIAQKKFIHSYFFVFILPQQARQKYNNDVNNKYNNNNNKSTITMTYLTLKMKCVESIVYLQGHQNNTITLPFQERLQCIIVMLTINLY